MKCLTKTNLNEEYELGFVVRDDIFHHGREKMVARFDFGHQEIVVTACNMVFIRKRLVHAATQHNSNPAVHLSVCQVFSHDEKVPKIVSSYGN